MSKKFPLIFYKVFFHAHAHLLMIIFKSLSVSGDGGRKGEMILQSGEHQAEDRKRKSPALKDTTHNR
jgi:hypothetical protein